MCDLGCCHSNYSSCLVQFSVIGSGNITKLQSNSRRDTVQLCHSSVREVQCSFTGISGNVCKALITNEENSSQEERLRSFLNQMPPGALLCIVG